MKSIKGILKYMGIVIASIIVLCGLVLGLMFFTKAHVFGLYFLQVSEVGKYLGEFNVDSIKIEKGDFNINIDAERYGVIVIPHNSSKISVHSDNEYLGFLKDEHKQPHTSPDVSISQVVYDGETTPTINIKINEPSGLLAIKDSCQVVIRVPHSIKITKTVGEEGAKETVEEEILMEYNIGVKTTTGNITLSHSIDEDGNIAQPLNANALSFDTRKGEVITQGFKSDSRDIELDSLTIKSNGGKFDFTRFNTITIVNKVRFDGTNATYNFNTLRANKGIEIVGEVVKFTATNVYAGVEGFIYKSDSGVLDIDRLITGDINETVTQVVQEENKFIKKVP